MEAKDISISVKLGTKYVYVSLDKLTENERQTLFECLKNGDFERAGKFMNQCERTHELQTDRTKGCPSPERHRIAERKFEQQTSLGQKEDFGNEPDVEDTYEKAKNGDEKALRLIGAWANQGDKRAKIFLIQISKTPERPRERVMIL